VINKLICFYRPEIRTFLHTTMECLLGIAFRDFVLIAADMSNAHSIMVMKDGKFGYFL
jgi:hypothetical protein